MKNPESYQPELSRMYRLEKVEEMCKSMIDESRSKQLLYQYEDSTVLKISSKLNDKVKKQWKQYSNFLTLSDMINLKGNKRHQNPDLKRFLILKLYSNEDMNVDARKQLWIQFTDLRENNGFYELVKKHTSSQRYFDETIHKDLNRTKGIPQHLKMTENVLTTMAKYNPFVGYCQGFNNIIMFLIEQGFTEEQSFFIWKYISLQILPTDYYTSMISILSDVDIIMSIFCLMNPKCIASFHGNKEKLTSMILPWLICLFTRQPIPMSITRMLWDFLLVEGLVAIYKAALALLTYVQDVLEDPNDDEMVRKAQQRYKKLSQQSQWKKIKTSMQNTYINYRILTLCRSLLCLKYEQKQNEISRKTKPQHKQCNINSHICVQQLQNNRYELMLRSHECQSFRVKKPIKIVQNYLDLIEHKDFGQGKRKQEKEEDLILIGRINHVCQAYKKEVEQNADSSEYPRGESKLFNYKGMQRTESMAFLQVLMENPSFSNLLQMEQIWENRFSFSSR